MSELEEQIAEQVAAVEGSLTSVDEVFGNLGQLEYDEVVKKMSSLDRAKYDLTNLYAINSLFWMYTRSFGDDPSRLPIKEELDRIKQQMMRVKQIGDKSKMPKVNKEVAQRLIRHGVGGGAQTSKQSKNPAEEDEDWDQNKNQSAAGPSGAEPMETDIAARGKKRKLPKADDNGGESSPSSNKEGGPHSSHKTDKAAQNDSVLSNSDEEYVSAQE